MARGKASFRRNSQDCCRTTTWIKPINFLYAKTKYPRPIIMHPSTKNLWRDRKIVSRDNLPPVPRVFPAESRYYEPQIGLRRPITSAVAAMESVPPIEAACNPAEGTRRCFNKRLVPNRKSFNPFRSRLTRVLYAFKRRGYFWRRGGGRRRHATRNTL